jgi:hypothetical protein
MMTGTDPYTLLNGEASSDEAMTTVVASLHSTRADGSVTTGSDPYMPTTVAPSHVTTSLAATIGVDDCELGRAIPRTHDEAVPMKTATVHDSALAPRPVRTLAAPAHDDSGGDAGSSSNRLTARTSAAVQGAAAAVSVHADVGDDDGSGRNGNGMHMQRYGPTPSTTRFATDTDMDSVTAHSSTLHTDTTASCEGYTASVGDGAAVPMRRVQQHQDCVRQLDHRTPSTHGSYFHVQQLEIWTALAAHFSEPRHQYDFYHGENPIVIHYYEFQKTLLGAELSASSSNGTHLFLRSLSADTREQLHSVAAAELQSQEKLLRDKLSTLSQQELHEQAMHAGATVDEITAATASHGVEAVNSRRQSVIDLIITMRTASPQPLSRDSARIVRQIRRLETVSTCKDREGYYVDSLKSWLRLLGDELHEFVHLDDGVLSADLDKFVRLLTTAADHMREIERWTPDHKSKVPHVRLCTRAMVCKLHEQICKLHEQRELTGGTVTWRAIKSEISSPGFVTFVENMKQDVYSDKLDKVDGCYTLDKLVTYLDRRLNEYPKLDFGADTLTKRAWSPPTPVAPPTPGPSLTELHTEMQQFRGSMWETVDGLARKQYAMANNNAHAFDSFKADVLREQEENFDWLRNVVAIATTKLRGSAQVTHVPQLDTAHAVVGGVATSDHDLEPRLQFTEEVDAHRQPVYKHVLGGTAQSPRFKCYHVLLTKVNALKPSKSATKHASNNCAPHKHGPDPATVAQLTGLMEEQVKDDLQQLRIDIKLKRVTVDTMPA